MSKSSTSNHIEAYARNGPHLKNSKLRKPSMAGVLAEFVREPQARPVCTERDRASLSKDLYLLKTLDAGETPGFL
jgi:hypothetical protein